MSREDDRHVPGAMRCAKCNFRVNRISLNVNVGTVTAGGNEPERCPNNCGPLWPITWEQEARDGYRTAEAMFDRAFVAETKLKHVARLLDPIKHWSVIVCDSEGSSPQVIEGFGADPQVCAQQAFEHHPWLQGWRLVAVVESIGAVYLADTARTAECALNGWPHAERAPHG